MQSRCAVLHNPGFEIRCRDGYLMYVGNLRTSLEMYADPDGSPRPWLAQYDDGGGTDERFLRVPPEAVRRLIRRHGGLEHAGEKAIASMKAASTPPVERGTDPMETTRAERREARSILRVAVTCQGLGHRVWPETIRECRQSLHALTGVCPGPGDYEAWRTLVEAYLLRPRIIEPDYGDPE